MKDRNQKRPQINSVVAIARLLDGDGFTEHVANQVRRYWNHCVAPTDRQRERWAKKEKTFKETVSPHLTDAQKTALGEFITLQEKRSFDAGLRIGLTTRMYDFNSELKANGSGFNESELAEDIRSKLKTLPLSQRQGCAARVFGKLQHDIQRELSEVIGQATANESL